MTMWCIQRLPGTLHLRCPKAKGTETCCICRSKRRVSSGCAAFCVATSSVFKVGVSIAKHCSMFCVSQVLGVRLCAAKVLTCYNRRLMSGQLTADANWC